jgi:hypothetical protein
VLLFLAGVVRILERDDLGGTNTQIWKI